MSERFICKFCGSDVELRGTCTEHAPPKRWIHVPSLDYRCLIFAEPYGPFGSPVSFPSSQEVS